MTRVWWFRAALLFLAGELVLHQARYAVAPADLVREFAPAHRYLWWVIPVVACLLIVAAAQWGARLRSPDGDALPELPPARALFAGLAVLLLAAFGVQEFTESLIFRDQTLTFGELAGGNGWVAVPLAASIGGVIALLLKGAVNVARWARERFAAVHRGRGSAPAFRPAAVVLVPRASVLAWELAGRAPPARV
jgi:hypothetical protein